MDSVASSITEVLMYKDVVRAPFHGGNTGSIPVGRARDFNYLTEAAAIGSKMGPISHLLFSLDGPQAINAPRASAGPCERVLRRCSIEAMRHYSDRPSHPLTVQSRLKTFAASSVNGVIGKRPQPD